MGKPAFAIMAGIILVSLLVPSVLPASYSQVMAPKLEHIKLCALPPDFASPPDFTNKCVEPLNRSRTWDSFTNSFVYNTTVQTIYAAFAVKAPKSDRGKIDVTVDFYVNNQLKLSKRANGTSPGFFFDKKRLWVSQAIKLKPGTSQIAVKVTDNLANGSYVYKELGRVYYPNHAPLVDVLIPAGGEMWNGTKTIQWFSSDIDDDELTFVLEYYDETGALYRIAEGLTTGTYDWDTGVLLDGSYQVKVTANDGIASAWDESQVFLVDNNPPVTVDDAPAGWQANDVTVALAASDNLAGIAATYYRVNGGEWAEGTHIQLTTSGVKEVEYYSADRAGNSEQVRSVRVYVDKEAPVSSGDAPNSWASHNVSFTLSAQDYHSGLDYKEYGFDGSTFSRYEQPILISEEGETTIFFRSVDNAGNVEETRTATVKIDKTPPRAALALEPRLREYLVSDPLPLEHFEEDQQSGIASITYSIDGTAVENPTDISQRVGTHTLTLVVKDQAGNENSTSVSFTGITAEGITCVGDGCDGRTLASTDSNDSGIVAMQGTMVQPTETELQSLHLSNSQYPHRIVLKSGNFTPVPGIDPELLGQAGREGQTYAYVMLREAPERAELSQLRSRGVKLLSSYNYYTFSVRLPLQNLTEIASLPFVYWIGNIPADFKVDPVLQKIVYPEKTFDEATNENYRNFVDYLSQTGRSLDDIQIVVSSYQNDLDGRFEEQLKDAGLRNVRKDDRLAFYFGVADAGTIGRLASLDFVKFISVLVGGSPLLAQSAPLIDADYLRSSQRSTILDGSGINVGIIDSGYFQHSDLPAIGNCRSFENGVWNSDCTDETGHGTKVAGIFFGRGSENKGIAPGVTSPKIAKICDNTLCYDDGDMLLAMSWMAQNPKPDVVSVSLGKTWLNCRGTDITSIQLDHEVYQNGQVYVVGAGNEGQDSNGGPLTRRIRYPGCAKNAITVGATLDYSPIDGIWSSSSRGPTGDGRAKPDVVAPGCAITTTKNDNSYGTDCGTSLATPHVSGTVATMLQHYSWLRGYPERVKAFLMATSVSKGTASDVINQYGAGKIDAFAANWALDYNGGYTWYVGWDTLTYDGDSTVFNINLPSDAQKLIIFLTWVEPFAEVNADYSVLNNLNLYLDKEPFQSGGATFDNDWKSESLHDNVERIIVSDAAGLGGNYKIKVYAQDLNENNAPTQRFAIAYMVIRGAPQPQLSLIANAPATVMVGQPFEVTANVYPSSYIASGVYANIIVPSDVTVQSVMFTRKDGVTITQPSQASPVLGNILNDGRSVSWTLVANSAGTKSITFRAAGSNTVNPQNIIKQVNVVAPNNPPTASFAFNPSSPTAGSNVQFTDQSYDSDGTIQSLSWNFGDGSTSAQQNPTHQYVNAGTYQVTLTVIDNQGAASTPSMQSITVSSPPPPPPPPPPQPGIMLLEDFEDGNANGWNMVSGSGAVVSGNLNGSGSYVLELGASGSTFATALYADGLSWGDYDAEFDAKLVSGNDEWSYLNFYVFSQSATNINNAYKLHLRASQNSMTLFKVVNGALMELGTVSDVFDFGQTYVVRLESTQTNIRVYVNGALRLDVADSTYRTGTIGVETHTGGGGWTNVVSHFDNIRLSDSLPPPQGPTSSWFEYSADAVPAEAGWLTSTYSGAPNLQTVSGGILDYIKPLNAHHYTYRTSSSSDSVAALSNLIGTTLEARIKVVNGGYNSGYDSVPPFYYGAFLDIRDGTKIAGLSIGEGVIQLGAQLYQMDTTNDFHVYRLTLRGNEAKVYVDGILVLSGTVLDYNQKFVLWGVSSSGNTDYARSLWDYVKYRNDGAYTP
ncbi:S8 family serine peptidase [archaeon]|nr:S8 family serine peptidase [archaeon]